MGVGKVVDAHHMDTVHPISPAKLLFTADPILKAAEQQQSKPHRHASQIASKDKKLLDEERQSPQDTV